MTKTDSNVIRSEHSTDRSYVRFVNTTCRNVDVIWMNYDGVRVKYKMLLPRSYLDVDTYVTHPWIFRDSRTDHHLIVNGKDKVFHPIASPVPPSRTVVRISIPMYTLKEYCIRSLRNFIHAREDVMSLEMPQSLKTELALSWNESGS